MWISFAHPFLFHNLCRLQTNVNRIGIQIVSFYFCRRKIRRIERNAWVDAWEKVFAEHRFMMIVIRCYRWCYPLLFLFVFQIIKCLTKRITNAKTCHRKWKACLCYVNWYHLMLKLAYDFICHNKRIKVHRLMPHRNECKHWSASTCMRLYYKYAVHMGG